MFRACHTGAPATAATAASLCRKMLLDHMDTLEHKTELELGVDKNYSVGAAYQEEAAKH